LDCPPYDRRGTVTDEYIQAYISLWSDQRPHYEGSFARVSSVLLNPKPHQKPHPPIWIGGNGKAAIRRAAALGDGWMPLHQSADDLRPAIAGLRELTAES